MPQLNQPSIQKIGRFAVVLAIFSSLLFSQIASAQVLVGQPDTDKYGFRFDGVDTNREFAEFTFEGQNTDLILHLTGFDIDNRTEVSVAVGGTFVGYLSRTTNNASGPTTLTIPADSQVSGENSLRFTQRRPGWRWGVTNISLNPAAPSSNQLNLGIVDSRSFGFDYDGVNSNREFVEFSFDGQTADLALNVSGFDIDGATEISVTVGGTLIGYLSRTGNNTSAPSTLTIDADLQVAGENVLRFTQRRPGTRWGMTDINLDIADPADKFLQFDVIDTRLFGHNFNGVSSNLQFAEFTFEGRDTELSLNVSGYDIDNATEVSVTVGNTVIGYLSRTTNNATGPSTLTIPASIQVAGENSLRFTQRRAGWKWGITDVHLFSPFITAPALLNPAADTQFDFGDTVQFQWSVVAEAERYEFELRAGNDLQTDPLTSAWSPANTCSNDVCSISALLDFPVFGNYTWRVRAVNDAATSDWVIANINVFAPTPATPINLTPLANTNLNEGGVTTFVWEQDSTADAYDFHIFNQSDTGQLFNFVTDLQPEIICADTRCSLDVALDIPVNTGHAWRVRAKNTAGISGWSRTTFNIIEPITAPPETPTLIAPVAGGIVETNTSAQFFWSLGALATSYEVELISDTTLSASVDADSCSATQCSATFNLDLPANEEYIWRVRSVNPIGTSDWVSAQFYTIDAATDAPETPDNESPAVGADVVENQVATFTWVHDPLVAVYDFHFFNNEPGEQRGTLPFILGLSPRDICSNGLCEFQTLVNLPVYTDHAWRVRATNSKGVSNWSRSAFNTVELITEPPLAPNTLSPLPNALLETDTAVDFSWNTSDTASRYELQLIDTANPTLDAPTAFVPSANCIAEVCSLSINLDLPLAKTYQWQVRAENAAGMSDWTTVAFEVIAKATTRPPVPAPLSPQTDALISQSDTIEFKWSRDTHAVTYEFFFFDALSSEELPAIVGLRPDDLCTDTECAFSLPVNLPVGAGHAWRVRGRNSLGASNWSRQTFEVIDTITSEPGGFELTSPIDNTGIIENTAITFIWTRAAQATSFELALLDGTSADASFTSVSIEASSCDVDFCTYTTTPALPASDLHQWQVRAINSLGESEWLASPLTIIAEPVELPAAPIVVAPLAGTQIVTGQTVDFEWQQDAEALSYEFFLTDADNGVLPIVDSIAPADSCVLDTCVYSQIVDFTASESHSWHVRAIYTDIESQWAVIPLTVITNINANDPVAVISIDNFQNDATGIAPLSLNFDPAGSTDDVEIVSFEWDFGDGTANQSTTTDESIGHTYTEPGSYTARLTVTDDAGLTGAASVFITVLDPATTLSANEASRFLTQATFGPTTQAILDLQSMGLNAWLDQQFTLQGPPHLDYVSTHSNGSNRAPRHEVWWSDVVRGDDQLRQRVAFALSQIFVVSDTGYTLRNSQLGITAYYDLMRDHAFGNFRELLEQVTLSPVMGLYLSMLQNAKTDMAASTRADENFAREVLQLFTIGLHELNLDGTTNGNPVFTQNQIEAFARVFTGWNYANTTQWNRPPFTGGDLINPMRPFASFHDNAQKTLLNGVVAPAGLTAREDLEFALDNIFNHANVAPFISKQLIKRLVTSNPTPAYVERVATVFNNDGSGERGNLQAVIKAILIDDEARQIPTFAAYGKLREPLLRLSHLWRAFNIQPGTQSSSRNEFNTGSPELLNLDTVTGQSALRSPSVFNFFQPSFAPAGPVAEQNLVAPEFELFTESNELATTNRIGRQIQEAYLGNPDSNGRRFSYLDFTYERSLSTEPDALLDHLDTLLLSGNMSNELRQALGDHLSSLPATDDGLSQRVRDAITLIMASPDYLVQM